MRLVRVGYPIAAVVALALAFSLLLISQTPNFRTLHTLKALSCHKDFRPPGPDGDAAKVLRCRGLLVLPDHDPALIARGTGKPADLALLAPIFRDVLAVAVNGVPAGQARLNQWRMPARLATVPTLIALPGAYLRTGSNRLDITVVGLAGREPLVGRLYIGQEHAATEQFQRLWFTAEVLPTLILGGQAALALMFLLIWNRRRQEAAFGWFALTLILDTLRGSPIMSAVGIETAAVSYWSLLVPFSSAAYLMFARAVIGLPVARVCWRAWAGPFAIALAAGLASPGLATRVLMPLGVAIICINLLWASAVLAAGWRRGITEARLLCFCTVLFAGLILHDVLLSLQVIPGQVAVARPGLLVLLGAVVALMIKRFTSAMAELDQTAETLRIRTSEIEAQLRLADAQLRQQREDAILAQERARLMRDLHDGLGGEMVAVLALAERGQGQGDEIAYHARAALSDMRLIIASLENYGGDLALALGAWKERAEPRILAAKLVLRWELGDLGNGLPFGPRQILEILRILQEALTNVIHHASATSITVSAYLDGDLLILAFSDDGIGIAPHPRSGKGLANMHSRSAALGGELTIKNTGNGTLITLSLPCARPIP